MKLKEHVTVYANAKLINHSSNHCQKPNYLCFTEATCFMMHFEGIGSLQFTDCIIGLFCSFLLCFSPAFPSLPEKTSYTFRDSYLIERSLSKTNEGLCVNGSPVFTLRQAEFLYACVGRGWTVSLVHFSSRSIKRNIKFTFHRSGDILNDISEFIYRRELM